MIINRSETTTAPAVPSSKMPDLHSFHKSESSVNAIICIKPNTCTLVPRCEASSVFASNQGSLEQRRVECSPACLFYVIMECSAVIRGCLVLDTVVCDTAVWSKCHTV